MSRFSFFCFAFVCFSCSNNLEKQGWKRGEVSTVITDCSEFKTNACQVTKHYEFYGVFICRGDSSEKVKSSRLIQFPFFNRKQNFHIFYYKFTSDSTCSVKLVEDGKTAMEIELSIHGNTTELEIK